METEKSEVRPTCSIFELLVLRSHGRNLGSTSGSCVVFLSLYVSKWVLITSSLHSTALKRHLKVSLWSKNLRFFINRFALFIQVSCNKNAIYKMQLLQFPCWQLTIRALYFLGSRFLSNSEKCVIFKILKVTVRVTNVSN
jgi:hypothetical protein